MLVGVSRDQLAGRRDNVIGWWEMTFSFVTWSMKTRDQFREDTRLADWIWRQRSRSFSWPAGCCFKSREAWASALWRWYSWPVWSRFIFSAGCTLKPVSWPSTALTTDTNAGSIRVGLRVFWRNLQNSSLASDEKILELGWCDWCFTAEKSVPVRSEECTCDGEFLPFTVFNYVDWSSRVVLGDVSMVTVAGRL